MTIWFFADIDDNVVTTSRERPDESAIAVAWHDGRPCAWLTTRQRELISMMSLMGSMVPTTARSSAGCNKLELPWAPQYRIVSFGGVIIGKDGAPEPDWHARMEEGHRRHRNDLTELLNIAQDTARASLIDVRCRILSDWGLDLYLTVKHNQRNISELALLKEALNAALPDGWRIHFNGNFLAVLPPHIGKEYAVSWFKENVMKQDDLTIGSGDSHTDVPFMGECDFMLMPRGSQNHRLLTGAT